MFSPSGKYSSKNVLAFLVKLYFFFLAISITYFPPVTHETDFCLFIQPICTRLLGGTRDLYNCLFWKFLRELNSRNSISVRESGTTTTIHNSYNNLIEHSESIALKQMPPSAFRTDHKKCCTHVLN